MKKYNFVFYSNISIFLFIFLVFIIFPILFIIFLSFKKNFINNYVVVFKNYNFGVYIINSLFVSVVGSLISVFICLLAAYFFYKNRTKFSQFLLSFISVSFLFPAEAKVIYNFFVIMKLGLLDKLVSVFLPFLVNLYTLLLFVQAFRNYSKEIDDYTELEGFNIFQKIFFIHIPILKPYIVTGFIMNFLTLWNDFLWPLIVLQDEKKYTIQVGINYIAKALIFEPLYFSAAVSISIVIPMIVFILFNRYFEIKR
ncbi:MAG: carbohydrate ABC transporter permease [bacterium]|nr:carbohydrate ABC transporter permease [bacterium]